MIPLHLKVMLFIAAYKCLFKDTIPRTLNQQFENILYISRIKVFPLICSFENLKDTRRLLPLTPVKFNGTDIIMFQPSKEILSPTCRIVSTKGYCNTRLRLKKKLKYENRNFEMRDIALWFMAFLDQKQAGYILSMKQLYP